MIIESREEMDIKVALGSGLMSICYGNAFDGKEEENRRESWDMTTITKHVAKILRNELR